MTQIETLIGPQSISHDEWRHMLVEHVRPLSIVGVQDVLRMLLWHSITRLQLHHDDENARRTALAINAALGEVNLIHEAEKVRNAINYLCGEGKAVPIGRY